jgi:transglutaminase-like putative cysteine protease
MSRGLTFYKDNNRLANYLVISQSSTVTTGKGLNYKETLTANQIAAYLKATTNCQVNNAAIKNIVASVTKGLTSDYSKAKAIFEYVRDKVSYNFYFNTKYGAVKTLSNKKGNCVDHAHLIVAMCRSAGIAARYVHGNCKFTSGSTYGHVWAQVYVNGKWYVADATSSRNSFGNIVNWNTKSFKLNNIYTSLPF